MNKIFVFLILLLSTSCTSLTQIKSKFYTTQSKYTVINLGEEFESFWKEAESKNFSEQLKIWDRLIEGPHQDLYDSLVYSKKYSNTWQSEKLNRLKRLFDSLPASLNANNELYSEFNNTIDKQIESFKAVFPDAVIENKIYAIPGASFNGKVNDLYQTKETVLAFGINVMLEMEDDPEVLYSHELFHLYHRIKLNIDDKTYYEQAKLTLPLWMEGLATYVSEEMNPSTSKEKILMSSDLAKVPPQDIQWLAKKFIEEAEEKAFDEKNPEIVQQWFTFGRRVREDIPTRAGYLLGYLVAKNLGQKYSSAEMASWPLDRLHLEAKGSLEELANPIKE